MIDEFLIIKFANGSKGFCATGTTVWSILEFLDSLMVPGLYISTYHAYGVCRKNGLLVDGEVCTRLRQIGIEAFNQVFVSNGVGGHPALKLLNDRGYFMNAQVKKYCSKL